VAVVPRHADEKLHSIALTNRFVVDTSEVDFVERNWETLHEALDQIASPHVGLKVFDQWPAPVGIKNRVPARIILPLATGHSFLTPLFPFFIFPESTFFPCNCITHMVN
jgi:hypothetical protein